MKGKEGEKLKKNVDFAKELNSGLVWFGFMTYQPLKVI